MFKRIGIEALAMTSAIALLGLPAIARAETLLYSFHKAIDNGRTPLAHLHLDQRTGVLYGTTEKGGEYRFGTLFKLVQYNGIWEETVLHSFAGNSGGAFPQAGVYEDSTGALYGTTEEGGIRNGGTAFKLTPSGGSWNYEVLHSFGGGNTDGSHPFANLIQDPTTSVFYGTTYNGGAQNCGVVFQLSRSGQTWNESILYSLGGSSGCNPQTPLRQDSLGNLYGTTIADGQYGYGNVYQLTQGNNGAWSQTVLHNFSGGSDGEYGGELDIDPAGTLYGVTFAGGLHGDGTIYDLIKNGGSWKETVLYSFAGGSTDGSDPYGIHEDANTGALYGSTETGGSSNDGTLFQLTQSGGHWTESVIHYFSGRPGDGAFPQAGPAVDDKSHVLYGTTVEGGSYNLGSVYSQVF